MQQCNRPSSDYSISNHTPSLLRQFFYCIQQSGEYPLMDRGAPRRSSPGSTTIPPRSSQSSSISSHCLSSSTASYSDCLECLLMNRRVLRNHNVQFLIGAKQPPPPPPSIAAQQSQSKRGEVYNNGNESRKERGEGEKRDWTLHCRIAISSECNQTKNR